MLEIVVPAVEKFDERTNEFVYCEGGKLLLEHSLISVSKWESKWQKPFLSKEQMTDEQARDYVRCMVVSKNYNPDIFENLTRENLKEVADYINNPMTATTFRNDKTSRKSNEIITSELIYYWMVSQQIPMECQKWHLNRLMTLIRVCSVKNEPPKKMSDKAILQQNAQINAMRKAKLGTRG